MDYIYVLLGFSLTYYIASNRKKNKKIRQLRDELKQRERKINQLNDELMKYIEEKNKSHRNDSLDTWIKIL